MSCEESAIFCENFAYIPHIKYKIQNHSTIPHIEAKINPKKVIATDVPGVNYKTIPQ